MTKRGKVLREPASGPGLLIMEGQQYYFSREEVWKSDTPPKPGLVVDVELDPQGKVQAITPVPDSQLAREQAELGGLLAPGTARNKPALVTRIGIPRIAAVGLLAVSWLVLPAVSVHVPFPGRSTFTFWQMLGFLNPPGHVAEFLEGCDSPGAGPWGFVALFTLAGPFLHQFWNDRRAFLGGLLPLAFMIVVGIAIHGPVDGINTGASKIVSLGSGIYLSTVAALYFALASVRAFIPRAGTRHQMEPSHRKAA